MLNCTQAAAGTGVASEDGTWHLRRFVATVSEACTFLNIQEEAWTWQEGALKPAGDKSSQQQVYVPFLMF